MVQPKKVLIVAYNYPPINNGGVQRTFKFSKYLPFYGYEPIVITCGLQIDGDFKHKIYRFRDWGQDLCAKGGLFSFLYKLVRKIGFDIGLLDGYNQPWFKEIRRKFKSMEIPTPDLVFATYPPIEDLLLGVMFSKFYKIPLVADFRDGFVYEPLNKGILPTWYMRQKRIEKYIVENASYIITVTDPITNYFKQTYPECRAITITNGYDEDDWETIDKIDLGNKINMVYTGRLSASESGRTIIPFLDAIKFLDGSEKAKLAIHMVGQFTNKEEYTIFNYGYKDLFKIKGIVSRKEALSYQISADILLLFTAPGKKSVATGKLFEYLASNKPIFALTSGTAAEEIIQATGTGICVNTNDVNGIAQALKKIIKSAPNFDFYHPNYPLIAKYSRKLLTQKLALVFDQVL